ncbi:MAG: hypothetical protein QOF83_1877 [Solirubrobacteraceae bacterium]|nr:hypothetical protein [Solirubrobacteraceae bacterium]
MVGLYASAGRTVVGLIVAIVGALLILLNKPTATALVAGQREGIGTLLGSRRRASDRLHTSRAFTVFARLFVAAIGLFFIVAGIGTAVT